MMFRMIACFTVALPLALGAVQQRPAPQLADLFTQVGINAKQRDAIDAGKAVANVLPWGNPSEVYVFGAIYIDGSPAVYLASARNVSRLAGSPGYLAIGELPAVATGEDLSALTLDQDDVKALKSCREGACDVQLPTNAIEAFHGAIDWSQPDAASQVNGLARGMVLDLVRAYRRGGNTALGVYRDKQNPARVADQFETMLGRSAALPEVAPELRRYLLNYPDVELPGADSFIYWEKVDFGMKPTIRVNHGVIYRTGTQPGDAAVVAVKQLYASHYFHTALDVSVCVADADRPERRGFYLLTLKSSEQDGLTGFKGSALRKIVVDRTRSSLESALASIKRTIEQSSPSAAR